MPPLAGHRRESGVTLVELVVAIVIIGVVVVGALGLLASLAAQSADSMSQTQSIGIARAYLDEILAMPTADPDPIPSVESARNQWDDIQDYASLPDDLPRTRAGAVMAGLNDFRVAVTIQNSVTLGIAPNAIANATLVTITVTNPVGSRVTLSGYRTPHSAQILR